MIKAGLVLEGGGLRGVFTAGVLDVFMDKDLYFSDIFAVSAGSTNALSYLSKQKGRTLKVNVGYVRDRRYLSMGNYLKERSIFGFDFIFNDIANTLEPFDYDTYNHSTQRLVAVASNCKTGKAEYFDRENCNDMFLACRASCSMPYVAPIVHVNNIPCLDGGVSDAIPIAKSIQEGNTKNVIILTRDKTYRKLTSAKTNFIIERTYRHYPNLVKALIEKSDRYNKTLQYIEQLEQQKKVFVIRPEEPVAISRTEKDTEKLKSLYMKGYMQALNKYDELIKYLQP